MKQFKSFIKEQKKSYVGNCVNSFDNDGECTSSLPYRDTTDFAQGEENAEEITKTKFDSEVDVPNHLKKLHNSKHALYLHDKENDVHMLYDTKKDVHHFFVSKRH
jgi:hypothetical protein